MEAYKAIEAYVEKDMIHSIGLSNWYVEELTDFLPQVSITPALVQNEIHPYYQEKDVVPFIQEHIKENLDLFGFELTDDEMEQIATLDRGEKHDWY